MPMFEDPVYQPQEFPLVNAIAHPETAGCLIDPGLLVMVPSLPPPPGPGIIIFPFGSDHSSHAQSHPNLSTTTASSTRIPTTTTTRIRTPTSRDVTIPNLPPRIIGPGTRFQPGEHENRLDPLLLETPKIVLNLSPQPQRYTPERRYERFFGGGTGEEEGEVVRDVDSYARVSQGGEGRGLEESTVV